MKTIMSLLSVAVVIASCCNSASAEDSKLKTGVKKVGTAIVWPFKKVGQGLVAMGHGAKKLVGKG